MYARRLFPLLPLAILFVFLFWKEVSSTTLFVSPSGDNSNPGTIQRPYKTIQKAVDNASAGTKIHILPGLYRETVLIRKSGIPKKPIIIFADPKDRGNVIIAGSESSGTLQWQQCSQELCADISPSASGHVYTATIPWEEKTTSVYEKIAGEIEELPIARSPNWEVTTPWKYHEHWWVAKDSEDNLTTVKDKDNLRNIGDLRGGTMFLFDGADRCGIFLHPETITHHDLSTGTVSFDKPVGFSIFGSQEKGISRYSSYYVEGKPQLLDAPGEWYVDAKTKRIYLWSKEERNPEKLNIEISRRSIAFDLSQSSDIVIDGITFSYFGESNQYETNGAILMRPASSSTVRNITIQQSTFTYTSGGIALFTDQPDSFIKNIKIASSRFSSITRNAFQSIGKTAFPPTISGVQFLDSEVEKSGFRYNDLGVEIARTDNVIIRGNYVHDEALYGIHTKSYEASVGYVKNIVIEKNRIERVCQNASSCSAIKVYGGEYKNTIVSENMMKDNIGWSYCQQTRNGGNGFAHGLFISNASGVKVERNISLNNNGAGFTVYPRQLHARNNIFRNNLSGYNQFGIALTSPEGTTNTFDYDKDVEETRHENSVIENNIFLGNKSGLALDIKHPERVSIDYNAYIDNGEDVSAKGISVRYASDVKTIFSGWDNHSFDTATSAFFDAKNGNFNISYGSPLRGRGKPRVNQFINAHLFLLGLAQDIGPCRFNWIHDSCSPAGNYDP